MSVPTTDSAQHSLRREISQQHGVLPAEFGLVLHIAAPRRTAGYANDSWEGSAIGWCGREP